MRYFKDSNGDVWAYEDDVPEELIKAELVPMTQQEIEAHLNPPPPPPAVPEQVSRAQGKAVLITTGIWPDVLTHVEAMTDPTEKALAEVALNDTTHWRRDSPTLQVIATTLGITSEQMDDLFITASNINL